MAENILTYLNGGSQQKLSSYGSSFAIARVTKVIYSQYLPDGNIDPDYENITSIGAIRYVLLNSAQYDSSIDAGNKIAKPAFFALHHYPVENEYVYLIPGPGLGLNDKAGSIDFYYLPPFGLWRAPNHNAFPNLLEYANYMNATKANYNQNTQGFTNKTNNQSPAFPLGNDFVEMENIKSLRPFTGDVLLEGRYGQSIRFGSSNKANVGQNAWATSDKDGDPIIIISNGQGKQANQVGYELTVENIDIDQSSIYLTAGQPIDSVDIPGAYPMASWDLVIDDNAAPVVVAETTLPIITTSTLSPKQQDDITTSTTPPATVGAVTTVTQFPNLSEEELQRYDQEYINFYNDYYAKTGKIDDGFDTYYGYKLKSIPKTVIRDLKEWRVRATGTTAFFTYDAVKFPTLEALYAAYPNLKKKVDSGLKTIELFEGKSDPEYDTATTQQLSNFIKYTLLTRNESKIKTINNTRGRGT